MKTFTFFRQTVAALMAIGLISCETEQDEPIPSPISISTIQFQVAALQLNENEADKIVSLNFDKPANRDGVLVLEFDTQTDRIITDRVMIGRRMEINITKGQTQFTFKIIPVDNTQLDGNTNIRVSISSVSAGFAIGTKNKLAIALADDDQPEQPIPSEVGFTLLSSHVREDVSQHELVIQFSQPITVAGSFEIEFNSTQAIYNTHYRSVPEAVDGKLVITPAVGATTASVHIIPIDNAEFSGAVKLMLAIENLEGGILAGEQLTHEIEIKDDELIGMPKGYTTGGSLGQSKTFTYDAQGRISTVHVKSSMIERTDTYYYDDAGRLVRINSYPEFDKIFTWTGDRITKSEKVEYGVVKQTTEYDYDVQGNVSGTANYFRQADGEMKLAFLIVYLYYTDNNLYKTLYYQPVDGEEEYTLLSTRTYDNYQESENPFPMVDILPTVKTQQKLPGTYRLEEHGMDLLYNIEYEFGDDGRVTRRYARNGNTSETTEYFYY